MHSTQHARKVQARTHSAKSLSDGWRSEKQYGGLKPCSCSHCNGKHPVMRVTDTKTGEALPPVERESRAVICDRCGGYNEKLRRRLVAHYASLIRRRDVQKEHMYFITNVLERRAVAESDLSAEASHQVLTGASGKHTHQLRRFRYHDPESWFFGVVASRPSDLLAHSHLFLATDLPPEKVEKIARAKGLDVLIKTPRATDTADDFAACIADYLFTNAILAEQAGGSFRFVATNGVGYYSERQKERRRRYMQARNERPAKAPSGRSNGQSNGQSNGATSDSIAQSNENEDNGQAGGGNASCYNGHPSPEKKIIQGSGTLCSTDREVREAVERLLLPYIGQRVHSSKGEVVLCQLQAYPRVEVRTPGTKRRVTVDWQELAIIDAPRRVEALYSNRSADAMKSKEEQEEHKKKIDREVKRFEAVARYGRVTRNGETKIYDYKTGQVFVEQQAVSD